MHFTRDRAKGGLFARWFHLPGERPADTTSFPKGKLLNEKFLKRRKRNIMREMIAPDSVDD